MNITPEYIKRLKDRVKEIETLADSLQAECPEANDTEHIRLSNSIKCLAGYLDALE